MDISFKTDEGIFNFRVCGVITNNNKLLAMHDERSPYYYLPGGRVKLHETCEDAITRELQEELNINVHNIKPIWMCQNYFTEDVNHEKYHEICIYYLIDVSETSLDLNANEFICNEGTKKLMFEWLKFTDLKSKYLYPLFIKDKIFSIPQNMEMIVEYK
jgi:ADP-ribose pyrophosphatase YjhB (NUDIX family)